MHPPSKCHLRGGGREGWDHAVVHKGVGKVGSIAWSSKRGWLLSMSPARYSPATSNTRQREGGKSPARGIALYSVAEPTYSTVSHNGLHSQAERALQVCES